MRVLLESRRILPQLVIRQRKQIAQVKRLPRRKKPLMKEILMVQVKETMQKKEMEQKKKMAPKKQILQSREK